MWLCRWPCEGVFTVEAPMWYQSLTSVVLPHTSPTHLPHTDTHSFHSAIDSIYANVKEPCLHSELYCYQKYSKIVQCFMWILVFMYVCRWRPLKSMANTWALDLKPNVTYHYGWNFKERDPQRPAQHTLPFSPWFKKKKKKKWVHLFFRFSFHKNSLNPKVKKRGFAKKDFTNENLNSENQRATPYLNLSVPLSSTQHRARHVIYLTVGL